MKFTKNITDWYLVNKRSLPWRKTKDPYFIWLSEIIMQQTQIKQGLPYYLKFVNAYPTVFDLANASLDDVLKLWQGLGYYSRARNLHTTAQYVAENLNGIFPNTYKQLLQLKGVGDYTASAIASISYNEPCAVVDGNVYRVLSRYFGIDTPINTIIGKKKFKEYAKKQLDTKNPGNYNQSIMEFGALQCKPQSPNCNICPLQTNCYAFSTNTVSNLPVKIKAKPVKKRVFNYIVPVFDNDKTLLQQRIKKGIWQNLYEFPLFETQKIPTSNDVKTFVKAHEFYNNSLEIESLSCLNTKAIIHKLSHQHLYTHFWKLKLKGSIKNAIAIDELEDFAVPVLIANFMESYFMKKAV